METDPDRPFPSDDDAGWSDMIDARDVVDANVDDWFREPTPGEMLDASLDDLERISVRGRVLVAERYRVIGEVLRHAEEAPDSWVGPDPTLDPGWVDPRDRSVAQVRWERRDFAVRAAAADIAVRLRMSENTVRSHASYVDTLRTRCPSVWASFLGGQVSEQNAMTAAQLAASLPAEDTSAWALFDEQVLAPAARLTPAKFRVRARAIRERVHAESLEQRHGRAMKDRDVWSTPELDGMAWLTALMPADRAHAAMTRLDATAEHLHGQDDETRTLAQLRADVLADLLTTSGRSDGASTGGPAVAITVPMMTLLGHSDEPATLDGYGPIDLNTAKRLAGSATSWIRILTHPVTGTILDADRKTYRVPKSLRRWLGVVHPVCVFPGCSRPARECHIDHLLDWQYGGKTKDTNLAPECEGHHRIRHGTNWTAQKNPDTSAVVWTSPTGRATDGDPPPF